MSISPVKEAAKVIASLRPPSSKPLRLVRSYSPEVNNGTGITVELEAGERVISPGAGTVVGVVKRIGNFPHSAGPLDGTPTFELTLSHNNGVVTVLKGLAQITFSVGCYVQRGDELGVPLTQEIFFGVAYNGKWMNPQSLSRHFKLQGEYVPAQVGKIRYAPDLTIRNLAGTIYSVVYNKIRYFIDRIAGFRPLLVNVDFNGDGTKVGAAALNLTPTDRWNVFQAGAFTWTGDYYGCCYYGCSYDYGGYGYGAVPRVFNQSPQTKLVDYQGKRSSIWLERVAAATAAAGTLASWDEMISSWIGGWSGALPEENFFSLRGMAAGTYRLCLYANALGRSPATVTTFYAAVNNGTPTSKLTGLTAATQWIEDGNYVRFDLVVPAGGVINIKAYGYFDGLQIQRLL